MQRVYILTTFWTANFLNRKADFQWSRRTFPATACLFGGVSRVMETNPRFSGKWALETPQLTHARRLLQRAAIDEAFRKESAMVLRWLQSKLKNHDDAQDVLQSVYARAIAFSDENAIENARALIFRVATRLVIDELRRRRRFNANHCTQADLEGGADASAISPASAPSSEEAFISREEYRAVMNALDKLPNKAKEAFLMNRVYGYTYAEIARDLGVSVSSVEKYVIKALELLRALNPRNEPIRAHHAVRRQINRPNRFLFRAARSGSGGV